MDTKLPQTDKPPKTVIVDWTESEWFQVWLQLARREYQDDVGAQSTVAARELVPA
jgi:hypothetical protein